MALGENNITVSLIKGVLGEISNNISTLCKSANINKWSKYKPVAGAYPSGQSGTYGLDLATWEYEKPTSNYRLGDFRKYEHDKSLAFPTIQCRLEDCTIDTINPNNVDNSTVIFKPRVFNASSEVNISPSDLGLELYYVGILIKVGSGQYFHKTYHQVKDVLDTGYSISVNGFLNTSDLPSIRFEDLPYGSGTYEWSIYISPSQATWWTTGQPTGAIAFPTYSYSTYNLVSGGTFVVNDFIYITDDSFSFLEKANPSGAPAPKSNHVYYPNSGVFTISKNATWLTVEVWNNDGSVKITHPSGYISGCMLKIFVTQNFGSARSDTVIISANNTIFEISVSQDGVYVNPVIQLPPVTDGFNIIGNSFTQSYNSSTRVFTVTFMTDLSVTDTTCWSVLKLNGVGRISKSSSFAKTGTTTTVVFGALPTTPSSGSVFTIELYTTPPL